MKAILAALDLSDTSLPVVEAARDLALQIGANVTLLHVVRPALLLTEIPEFLEEANIHAERTAAKILQDHSDKLTSAGVETTASVCTGDPSAEILNVIKSINPQYVVIGSHGRNMLTKLLIGSTGEGVIAHASCPILVVRKPGAQENIFHAEPQAEVSHA